MLCLETCVFAAIIGRCMQHYSDQTERLAKNMFLGLVNTNIRNLYHIVAGKLGQPSRVCASLIQTDSRYVEHPYMLLFTLCEESVIIFWCLI